MTPASASSEIVDPPSGGAMVVQHRIAVTDARRRRDAVRSRELLLAAARELFAHRGPHVPLVEVSRAAGVGQGTLYRHFRDRHALLMACARAELDTFDDSIAGYLAAAEPLRALFTDSIDYLARPSLLLELGRTGAGESAVRRQVRDRMRLGFDRLVARAVELGQVRADLTGNDVMLVFDMVAATLEDDDGTAAARRARAARAVDVALTGLLRR